MVEKSKEFLVTFNPHTTDKEKVRKHYENFIKNRDSDDLLFFDDIEIHAKETNAKYRYKHLAKRRIMSMHGDTCVICGTKNRSILEIHHVIPKSEGGTNEIGNLIPLCHICHCAVHKINNLNPYGMNMLRRVVDKIGEIA